jgi:putative ABC transport system permease protein
MDAMRDQRGIPALEHLIGDARHAARALRRNPLFTATAIATLTLAIGANAAIFSVLNSVVLKPLGFPQPDRLMLLTTRIPSLGFNEFWVSPPEYFEFGELNRSFASVGAYRPSEVNVVAGSGPMRVKSLAVDDRLLQTLGVPAGHGRWFERHEANINGPPVAILSHELWQSAFGGRAIVGETLDVDGTRRTVVGVMPPGLDVMDERVQIWLPLGLDPADRRNRAQHSLYVVGRLKSDVTEAAAQDDLNRLLYNWGALAGVKGPGIAGHVFSPIGLALQPGVAAPGHVLQMTSMKERVIGSARRSVMVVQAAVALILLIACANLASMLLARAEGRRQELSIRAAVGASRRRLAQLFVIEGLLLSSAAGILGVMLAYAAVPALARALVGSVPRTGEIAVDPVAIAVTLAISAIAGVAFGLAPIVQLNLRQLASSIRGTDARVAAPHRRRISGSLVVTQIALAVVVTIVATLLVRTVQNLAAVDGGFDRSRLVTFSTSLPPIAYQQPLARRQFYDRTLDVLRATPGVLSASAMSGLPLDRRLDALVTDMEGYTATPETTPEVVDYFQSVMANYFETMGIPIVRGRAFEPADAAAAGSVAIINETLARTFWKDQDPLGRRLRPCCADTTPWYTVIGVARDVPQQSVDRKPGSEAYFFVEETSRRVAPPATMHVVLRTALEVSDLRPTVERAIAALDPSVPVVRLRTMDEVFGGSIRRPQLLARLLGGFAALALLLSAIGIYGLLAYLVSGRRKEIGIRMVMGASRAVVVGGVMRQGLRLIAAGGAVGIAIAASLNRTLASLLFGVSPLDVSTYALALGAMTILGVIALMLPAWTAARVAPTVVLRDH